MRIFIALVLALLPCAVLAQSGTSGYSVCAAGTIAASGSSSTEQLTGCGPVVILYNVGSQEIFYNIGPTAAKAAATTSSYSLAGGLSVVLNVNTQAWYVGAITASSTSTLRIVEAYGSN